MSLECVRVKEEVDCDCGASASEEFVREDCGCIASASGEFVRMKEEVDWDCGASTSEECVRVKEEHGAREEYASVTEEEESAAAWEDLYAGHEVKRELVLGPEQLQPQDIAYSLRAERKYCDPVAHVLNTDERKSSSNTKAVEVSSTQTPGGLRRTALCSRNPVEKISLRPCFVRLERITDKQLGAVPPSQETFKQHSSLLSLHNREHQTKTAITLCDRIPESCFVRLERITDKQLRAVPTSQETFKQHSSLLSLHNREHQTKTAITLCDRIPESCFVRLERITDKQLRAVPTSQETFKQHSSLLSLHNREHQTKTAITLCDRTPGSDIEGKKLQIHTNKKLLSDKKPVADYTILNAHGISHSHAKIYTCEICGKHFSGVTNLDIHTRIHTGEKPYKCNICEKELSFSRNLKRHKRVHTGERPYACDICKKNFSEKSTLKKHLLIHTGEKLYVCDICKKKFIDLFHMKRHKRVHTGKKPHTCDICKRKFFDLYYLIQHKLIHMGNKPHTCDICKKQFSYLSNLNAHKRLHTGVKYTCNICIKQFSTLSYLKQHKRIHTGEKPYTCDYCSKQFSTLSYLKIHKLIHIGGEKSYTCEYCTKQFSTSSALKRHIRIHT